MNNQKGFTLVEGLSIMLILSVVGFAGYTVWRNNQNNKRDILAEPHISETYIACGCGGCGGIEPQVETLYESNNGKVMLEQIKKEDEKAASSPNCEVQGCSICTEYRLVSYS